MVVVKMKNQNNILKRKNKASRNKKEIIKEKKRRIRHR